MYSSYAAMNIYAVEINCSRPRRIFSNVKYHLKVGLWKTSNIVKLDLQCVFFMRTKVNANFTYLHFIEIDHLYLIFFIMVGHFLNFWNFQNRFRNEDFMDVWKKMLIFVKLSKKNKNNKNTWILLKENSWFFSFFCLFSVIFEHFCKISFCG